MLSKTVVIPDFSVEVSTLIGYTPIIWEAPDIPENAVIQSQTLQLLCSAPQQGSRTISVNGVSINAGILSVVDIGTYADNTMSSFAILGSFTLGGAILGTDKMVHSATLAYKADSNGVGTMQVTQVVYTVSYEIYGANPIIEIVSQDKEKIGVKDTCTIAFKSDMNLKYWEVRATTEGQQSIGHGVGLLVESGENLSADQIYYAYIDTEELTYGDLKYRIDVYGQSTTLSGGVWSDE